MVDETEIAFAIHAGEVIAVVEPLFPDATVTEILLFHAFVIAVAKDE